MGCHESRSSTNPMAQYCRESLSRNLIQMGSWLIHKERARRLDQHARERDPLTLRT